VLQLSTNEDINQAPFSLCTIMAETPLGLYRGSVLGSPQKSPIRNGNPRLHSCLAKPTNREKFGNVFAEKGLIAACDAVDLFWEAPKNRLK